MIFIRRSGKPVCDDKIEGGSERGGNGNDWESVGEASVVDCWWCSLSARRRKDVSETRRFVARNVASSADAQSADEDTLRLKPLFFHTMIFFLFFGYPISPFNWTYCVHISNNLLSYESFVLLTCLSLPINSFCDSKREEHVIGNTWESTSVFEVQTSSETAKVEKI